MKKTLWTFAALSAAVAGANAAQVSVYGTIDLGIGYLYQNNGTKSFKISDSQQTMDRIGLRGTEEIADGITVGFILENGFHSDSGKFADSTRLFNREATLYVQGKFGKLGFGRIGEFRSGNGSWCLYGAAIAPFSTAWGDAIPGHRAVMAGSWGRLDNAVAYKTPTVAGFTGYMQYSGGIDGTATTEENNTKTNRYYSAALSYRNGPLYAIVIGDKYDTKSFGETNVKDPITVSGAVTYETSLGKLFFDAQYFKEARIGRNPIKVDGFDCKTTSGYVDGFGLNAGIKAPVPTGFVCSNIGFMSAKKNGDHDKTLKRYTIALGYQHMLSKRTFAYAGAGYYQDVYASNAGVSDGKSVNVITGIVHSF